MPNWKIKYICENGFKGEVIVSAINRFMAFETFEKIAEEFDSKVIYSDAVRISDWYCVYEN